MPKGWPTLDECRNWRVELPDEVELDRILDAAEWAVRVRPQLEALVAELDRRIAENDWHPGYRAHLTFARDAILALVSPLVQVPLPRQSPDDVEAWAQQLAEDTGHADD